MSIRKKIWPYLQLMRMHQYVKNVLIFLPAFFAQRVTDLDLMWDTFLAFLAFSFAASTVYILNDTVDREEDRNHPLKKFRPLAAGTATVKGAMIQIVLLLAITVLIFMFTTPRSLYLVGAYLVMNIAYSFGLKRIPIIDLFIIALGFVLRLFVGSFVGDIDLSMWIILIAFLLALFLGLAKRRDDVLLSTQGNEVRKSIDGYNLEFINGAMILMASVTLVAYISYTISPEVQAAFNSPYSTYLYLTVFFVLMGILRYMQITFVEEKSGSPTRILLEDLFLQLTIVGWLVTFVILIY